ncbi:hypothetical protein KW516_05920 [Vibrio fluvialis]|nr:hypothetical protein [Vibrio fluvialis]
MDTDELIEMLKDRLEECCDCIEAGYEIAHECGRITTDAELTVADAREFIKEAKSYLEMLYSKEQEDNPCNTPQ